MRCFEHGGEAVGAGIAIFHSALITGMHRVRRGGITDIFIRSSMVMYFYLSEVSGYLMMTSFGGQVGIGVGVSVHSDSLLAQ